MSKVLLQLACYAAKGRCGVHAVLPADNTIKSSQKRVKPFWADGEKQPVNQPLKGNSARKIADATPTTQPKTH
jgi:hypothetical protein